MPEIPDKLKKSLIKITSLLVCGAIILLLYACLASFVPASAALSDFDTSNFAPANIDTWQSAPTNLRKLGEVFVSTLRSESGSDFFVGIIDDIPTSMVKVITDTAMLYPYCIEPYDDVYYYLDDDGNLKIYDPFKRSGRSGSGGINRFVSSSEDFVFSSKFFKDKVDYWGQYYSPKNTINRLSWQTDILSSNNPQQLGFFQEGSFAYNTDWYECYFIPFYYSGTSDNKYYYSQFQYHFYQKVDKAEDGSNIISLYVDVWNWYDNTEPSSFLITDKLATYRFGRWDFFYYHNTFLFYPLKSDYINLSNVLSPRVSLPDSSDLYDFTDSSLSSTIASSNVINYNRILGQKATPESIVTANHADYGFYVSDSAINMGDYGIDTSKIPDDYVITPNGDTVYDYTITNTTGDTTTINKYVTNNYYIPETDKKDDDQGGSSGDVTVSGDVNVKGDIDVSGKVDINVNVNGGSSSDPTLPSYDDFVNNLPDNNDTLSSYLRTAFDFLPPDILALVLGGVATAIICLIFKR